ncbi:glycoside hydrolase family 76 protein [Corynebacterium meitnerae]|uniref:Glycoside hydrolase family 76 n=1 Tax=Corynebacterium meitnerae TaxID=2913498 RepID=A0A9X3LUZ7_9CORY|nr:glycoside hydrolase family 76 protein [Corynebacterium meitnerae]MCZ9294675.1 glycoside hydrolase family 76 [Corynebacterium meitnerae]
MRPSVSDSAEMWAHRADLAEAAINERHASRLWGLPRTNLAVVAWPATQQEKAFVTWHYWWQAHYVDCQVDAERRQSTKARRASIVRTVRGIRIRNRRSLSKNRYYDDKAWLALALARIGAEEGSAKKAGKSGKSKLRLSGLAGLPGVSKVARLLRRPVTRIRALEDLEFNILAGLDSVTGVLPWRTDDRFFNVPANGPAAIMMARSGRLDKAREVMSWIFDHVMADNGLVQDGIRLHADGPRAVEIAYSYNQGTVLGAALEIAIALGNEEDSSAEEQMFYIARIHDLVRAVGKHMATPAGVIDNPRDCGPNQGGDGALFQGILARYLADVAVRLPDETAQGRAAKREAARLVMSSAAAMWNNRLEVDGLPVFPVRWVVGARLPHNYGGGEAHIGKSPKIPERDLSVQLSGWMLLEAAARVAQSGHTS